MTHRLSKSKIISGIQCLKRLWLEVHRPDLLEYDPSTQARMTTGWRVGEIACSILAPGGVLVGLDQGFGHALDMTSQHLALSTLPIYEATFAHDRILVRSDIVLPAQNGQDGLTVIEVKSSTKVKDYHYQDCAIQYRVLRGIGHEIREMRVAVIDNTFVYPGGGNYAGLLRVEDVTAEIKEMQPQVEEWIGQCLVALHGSIPDLEMGGQCDTPFGCPFQDFCTPNNRPEYPLSCLPRLRAGLSTQLLEEGHADIRDIPPGRLENTTRERVRRVTVSGQEEWLPGTSAILNALPFPWHFLDFETMQFAVPIWVGTRPYEQLPFQWSCHVLDTSSTDPNALRHLEFLDLTGQPPMRGFAESLLAASGTTGTIFVYGHFEAMIIRGLIRRFPDLEAPLQALLDRITDLLPIMREHYYHPQMFGSWSLKSILPCLAPDLSYAELTDVQHGGQAQDAYLEAIAPKTTPSRREELRKALVKYCALDTLGLVRIVEVMRGKG
ncbi:protein of unknown function [Desulfonatronum thiosulfatophilum]|uniref:DUF2779 domain-containing protein n=1 Tax=Desulfonatronum thiosulfatophilum TaxID=617002 RepID=A0A1G6DDX0_9BACT|nr:DUF2779 domain-containing protein [Desulfonatronum thiosulfatophilum]SDB43321.1 protein of unknown function [Desulfonatronum thiosulfatophilum]